MNELDNFINLVIYKEENRLNEDGKKIYNSLYKQIQESINISKKHKDIIKKIKKLVNENSYDNVMPNQLKSILKELKK